MNDVQKEDRDYSDKQDRQREIMRIDKKILLDWIEYYLYNYPELPAPKEYRTKRMFHKMQNQLEDLLWKLWDEVDKI